MSLDNLYQTPESNIDVLPADGESNVRFEKMATGQKLVIYAMLAYLAAIPVQLILPSAVLVLLLVSMGLSLVGVFKILSARESHIVVKVVLFALLFVPLINLLTLLSINSRATLALRKAGYKVSLMGAYRPENQTPALAT